MKKDPQADIALTLGIHQSSNRRKRLKGWLAVVIVSAFATLQHGFLPFRLEWQHFVYRCASSVPVIVVLCLLYLRQRRLLPIHVIHWAGNVLGIVALLLMPAGGG